MTYTNTVNQNECHGPIIVELEELCHDKGYTYDSEALKCVNGCNTYGYADMCTNELGYQLELDLICIKNVDLTDE
jgi:hypothetical protein